jgi:hypothetical protein
MELQRMVALPLLHHLSNVKHYHKVMEFYGPYQDWVLETPPTLMDSAYEEESLYISEGMGLHWDYSHDNVAN